MEQLNRCLQPVLMLLQSTCLVLPPSQLPTSSAIDVLAKNIQRCKQHTWQSNFRNASSHICLSQPTHRVKHCCWHSMAEVSSGNSSWSQEVIDTAVAAAELGDFSTAAEAFSQALQLSPNDAVLHEQYAQCLMELEQHEAALKPAHTATALQPEWPEGWVTLGRCCLNLGQLQAAKQAFSASLALNPEQPDTQQELAEVLQIIEQQLAMQIGLPGLTINTDPDGSLGPGCVTWEAGIQLAKLLVRCSQQQQQQSPSTVAPRLQSQLSGLHTADLSEPATSPAAGVAAAAANASCAPKVGAADATTVKRPHAKQQHDKEHYPWKSVAGSAVLELGSGTGLCGIVAAALGAHVTLTDLPELQPLLTANLAANAGRVVAAGGSAAAAVLDWHDSAVFVQWERWDWAMGADLVYNASQVQPVARLVSAILQGNGGSSSQAVGTCTGSSSSSQAVGTYPSQTSTAAEVAEAVEVCGVQCGRPAGFLLAHKHRHKQVDEHLLHEMQQQGLQLQTVAQLTQLQPQQRQQHRQLQRQDCCLHTGADAAGCSAVQCKGGHVLQGDASISIWWITAAAKGATAQQAGGDAVDAQQQQQRTQHSGQGLQRQDPPAQESNQQRALTNANDVCSLLMSVQREHQQQCWQQQQQDQDSPQPQQQRPLQRPRKLLLLSAGLAGVGKSTVLRQLTSKLGQDCVYIDKDTINAALLGGRPYFSDYYMQYVQQQTYSVMFGIAADNLSARDRCVVILDGQFGDKLSADYILPHVQAIRAGRRLAFHNSVPLGCVQSDGREVQQQQQQGEQLSCRQATLHNNMQQVHEQITEKQTITSVDSGPQCLVVLLLFDTAGCGETQLLRLKERGEPRDEGKYEYFEQYRWRELQLLEQELQKVAGQLDAIVRLDTCRDVATCVDDVILQLESLQA